MSRSLNQTTEFCIFDGTECVAFHMEKDDGTPFFKLAIDDVWTHEKAPTLEAIKTIAETYSDTPEEIVWGSSTGWRSWTTSWSTCSTRPSDITLPMAGLRNMGVRHERF